MTDDVVAQERGVVIDFPQVKVDRQKFVINQQGKDHVLFSGLVDALHQLSGGFFSVDTRIEQLPTADNGQTAVCSARVQVFDPDQPDVVRRSASGIGDASPANVNRMMATALIRMAETRAKARALRDLCNVGMVSFEELGQEEQPVERREELKPPTNLPPVLPGITSEGKQYTRAQVEAGYRKVLEEARAAGLALGEVEIIPIERTPSPILYAKGKELRRRIEAKAPADAG